MKESYLTDACIRYKPRRLAVIALSVAESKLGADLQYGFCGDLSKKKKEAILFPDPPLAQKSFSEWNMIHENTKTTPEKVAKSPQGLAKRAPIVQRGESLNVFSKTIISTPVSPVLSPLKRRSSEVVSLSQNHVPEFRWFEMIEGNLTFELLCFERDRILSCIEEAALPRSGPNK